MKEVKAVKEAAKKPAEPRRYQGIPRTFLAYPAALETDLTHPELKEFGAALGWELRTGQVKTELMVRVSWCVTVHANGGDWKRLVGNLFAQTAETHAGRVALQAITVGGSIEAAALAAALREAFTTKVIESIGGMPALMREIAGAPGTGKAPAAGARGGGG